MEAGLRVVFRLWNNIGCHLGGGAHKVLGSGHAGHHPIARMTATAREGGFCQDMLLVRANFWNWGKWGAGCSSVQWPQWDQGFQKLVRWPDGRGEADCGVWCCYDQVIERAVEGVGVAASGIVN